MRKYDSKNKRNIGIIVVVCLIFAIIFSYFLIKEIKLRQNKYELDSSTVLFDIDKNNILLNDISSFKKEHAEHNICERSLKYKDENFELSYCKDCDSYGTETIYYHNIINNRKLDDDYTI